MQWADSSANNMEELDDFPVDGEGLKKGIMRIPDAVDILAQEGKCVRYDQTAHVYTVTDGDAFLKGFCALRITRGKKDESQTRPFAGMHRFYTILQGEKWASNGTVFRKKDAEEKQSKPKRSRAQAAPKQDRPASREGSSSGSTPQPPHHDASSPDDVSRESSFPGTFPETVAASSVIVEVTGKSGQKECVNLQEFLEVSRLDELYRQALQNDASAGNKKQRTMGAEDDSSWWGPEHYPSSVPSLSSVPGGPAQPAADHGAWWDGWRSRPVEDVHAVVGGLWNASSRGDQAYFFERKSGVEARANGSIVKLVGGQLEGDESAAEGGLYMVVSDLNAKWKGEPLPSPEQEQRGHWCCFLGQVPLTVEGTVRCGDPIAPKGDGSGRGKVGHLGKGAVVGVALEDKEGAEAAVVKVLCFAGLGAVGGGGEQYQQLLGKVLSTEQQLEQVEREVAAVEEDVRDVKVEVEESKNHASSLQRRLDHLEASLRRWRPESRRMRLAYAGTLLLVIAAAVALVLWLTRGGTTASYLDESMREPAPVVPVQKKVLVVGLEGVPGSAVTPSTMPNLWRLLSGSTRPTYSTLSTMTTKAQADWSAILSGAGEPLVNGASSSRDSFFALLPHSFFTASVVRRSPLNQLLESVEHRIALESDAEVASAAIDILANGGPGGRDVDAMFVQLADGDASLVNEGPGYNVTHDAAYVKKLTTSVDANLAAIRGALLGRPRYAREDWLVVVVGGWYETDLPLVLLKAQGGEGARVPALLGINGAHAADGVHEDEVVEMAPREVLEFTEEGAYGAVLESTQLDEAAAVTVEALVKVSASWQGSPNVVGGFNLSTADAGWSMALADGGVRWRFLVQRGQEAVSVDGGRVADGLWHHLAATVDPRSGTLWLFQDGAVVANASLEGLSAAWSLPVVVGEREAGAGWHRSTSVDLVRLWSTARLPQQLTAAACQPELPAGEAAQLRLLLDRSSLAQGSAGAAALGVKRQVQVGAAEEAPSCNARTAMRLEDVAATVLCHLGASDAELLLEGRCWVPEHQPTCADRLQNGGEEGVDCGGGCGEACGEATCFDGVRNQDEEEADCGGACIACSCADGIVRPRCPCGDACGLQLTGGGWAQRNEDEEDVDCGGALCGLCCAAESPCTGPRGMDYRGCARHTVEGLECQRWDEQLPHHHSRTRDVYPDAGLVSNYCRNPDGEPEGPWCYTMDPLVRWRYCTDTCEVQPWVHCLNGVQDHGEAGVDCGGACDQSCPV